MLENHRNTVAASAGGRDLTALFDPLSIAVVGASDDVGKWGHWLAKGALRGAHRRDVYLINRAGGSVLGEPAYPTLAALPADPELVVVAVPEAAFSGVVDDALERNARAIVAIVAGFAEHGEEGRRRQREIVGRVQAAGASLLGPNCLGVVDNTTDLDAAWLSVGEHLPPGEIAMISQSGTVGMDVARLARDAGLGLSRFVSVGNQADITVADLIDSCAAHDETRMIALYCEDFRDGRAFLEAVHGAVARGKPVVLLAAGASDASSRAARSHTGAMTTGATVVEAVCRATGAIPVRTPSALIDVAQVLLRTARPAGERVAVISDGGGHGVIAADVLAAAGLDVVPFSDGLSARLAEQLAPTSSTGNPVDLAGAALEPAAFERAATEVAASGEVDAIMLAGHFGAWDGADAALAEQELASAGGIARAAANADVALLVHSMTPNAEAPRALRDHGAAAYRDIDRAVRGLRHAVVDAPPPPLLPLPAPSDQAPVDGYFAARELLADAGIPFARSESVEDLEEALAAADRIGYPVAFKAVGLLHKSDRGGVALGLDGPDALRIAFDGMRQRELPGPYAVEQMVDRPNAIELVVGSTQDPRFGPTVLVGFGGVHAELLADTVLAIAPVDEAEARRMLRRLRGAALLDGFRGAPAVDLAAAAAVVAQLSRVAAAHPDIVEVEINPLLVDPEGTIALDARAVPIARSAQEMSA